MRLRAAVFGLALGGALLASPSARAEVRRYALVVGANRGHVDERELRYAESDASKVADTLAHVGGFARNRIVQLHGASPTELRNALDDLNLVIQRDMQAGGGEAVLFVYYSGHGDAQAIHLGPDDLLTSTLSKAVQLSRAQLKVLVLDACRSGGITRVKSGRQVAPFQIQGDDRLNNEGYAIITSSAAGEDSQESEVLGSSIFTHHLLSALSGAGDGNGDRQVTMGEAYAYAYDQTLRTSIATLAGSQHATYHWDLRGRADPVLADLRSPADQAQLVLAVAGDYLITTPDRRRIVVDASTKVPGVAVVVPAGSYSVGLRGRTSMLQGDVSVKTGESHTIAVDDLRPVPYAVLVRKGGTDLRIAQGPSLAGVVHGPPGAGFSPMLGMQLSYALELPLFSVVPRLALQGGASTALPNTVLSHTVRETRGDLAVLHVFDFTALSLAPLVSVGYGVMTQTVTTSAASCPAEGCRYETVRRRGSVSVGGVVSRPLARGFSLEGGAELVGFILGPTAASPTDGGPPADPAQTRLLLTYRASVGVGYRF